MSRFFYSIGVLAVVFVIMGSSVHAQGLLPLPTGGCPTIGEVPMQCKSGKCVFSGGEPTSDALPCNYTISDILQTGIEGLNLIFGITGSIALLMFVYGGFLWLISGGSAEKIKQGTGILKNSVIAIIIILGASVMVRFVASDIFGVGVIESGQFKVGEAVCATAADSVLCGDHMQCWKQTCITQCYFSSIGGINLGYSCQQKLPASEGTCKEGLCPGGADRQCCITNEQREEIEKSKK